MTAEFARTKLSDHLLLHVCREIVRGDLAEGDNLASEHELVTQFGISKPIVRESLRALASLGLIHVQQGKRTIVQGSEDWNILDPILQEAFELEGRGDRLAEQLYELRLILETASASHAAGRATPTQVAEIRRLADALVAIASADRDVDTFLKTDREFHDAIARASGNEALRQVIRNVHDYLRRAWARHTVPDDEMEPLAQMHVEIAAAIADGDGALAGAAMARHVDKAAMKEMLRHVRPEVQ